MSAFEVVVETCEQSIRERSQGKQPIVCPIAIKLGEGWFPHEHWDDFALVILDWWIQRTLSLRAGEATSVKLDFMDGPYELDVERTSELNLDIRCVERKANGSSVRLKGACSLADFEAEIVTATRSVLAAVRRAGLWNDSCAELQSLMDRSFPLQVQNSR